MQERKGFWVLYIFKEKLVLNHYKLQNPLIQNHSKLRIELYISCKNGILQ